MSDALTNGYFAGFEPDPWNDLAKPVGQNIVDFWAAQYKTFYEFYFGKNDLDPSSDTPVSVDGLQFQGYVFLEIPNSNYYYGGDGSGSGLLATWINLIEPYQNPILHQEIIAYTNTSYNYGDMAEWAANKPLSIDMNPEWLYQWSPAYGDVVYSPNANNLWESLGLDWVRYPDTFHGGSFYIDKAPRAITLHDDGTYTSTLQLPRISPRGGYPYSVPVGNFDADLSNAYCNTIIVDPSTTDMRTFTYITNEGDTITTYYNDHTVINDTRGKDMSFDELTDYFNMLLVDIKQNFSDVDSNVVFPSWDDLNYIDQGNFYIEPLHQYDQIPVAPTFNGTIDLADYPTVLAEGANIFLDFMPATLSALFTAAFVACVVIRKLGR